jgi:uncharacterized protein YbjQ (UPF0145 family)
MFITTTDSIAGHRITSHLGLVRGNTIRAKHVGKDILAGLRMIVGGEITQYTEMLTEARNEAILRMKADAGKIDADAVVNVRFVTAQVMTGAAELLAYGTAVKVERLEDNGSE